MTPELLPEDFPAANGWRAFAEDVWYSATMGDDSDAAIARGVRALYAMIGFMNLHGTQEKKYKVYVPSTDPILNAARRRVCSTRNTLTPNRYP